jgi:hypothetical protein
MSVLQCDRAECENIMCDRFSSQHGYLCGDCFDELLELGKGRIEDFMKSPKPKEADRQQESYRLYVYRAFSGIGEA